ncbi:MAG: MerR family transcriptional regulator [Bacteroidota bacterium]|nr:MerR family transcriptional regulator [Bacteroidota bacterium]
MPYKAKEIEKKYYTIGEVAQQFGVATSLIRFWESEFENIKPVKNKKGNRVYTKEDIEDISIVYHYVKEKGFTLQGAKEIIRMDKQKNLEKIEAIKSLEKVKDFLMELKKGLESSDKN